MADSSNNLEIIYNSADLQEIAQLFKQAIDNKYLVELRVEDMPSMSIDSILKTYITKVAIDEERKNLHIDAPDLQLMFNYETYALGTQSSSHAKFYFESKGASLTVTVLA